jgi:type IV pilus assembly protein PilM
VELPSEHTAGLEELQRAVAVTAAYFEDALGLAPARILYAGPGGAEELAEFLQPLNDLQIPVRNLVERPSTGYSSPLPHRVAYAGVLGALAG